MKKLIKVFGWFVVILIVWILFSMTFEYCFGYRPICLVIGGCK